MINKSNEALSVRQQSVLLGIHRSNIYYVHCDTPNESALANEIHEIWMEDATYGYRRITHTLKRRGYDINYKRVLRIMRATGIEALYPKPRTSSSNKAHKKHPYLLRDLIIHRPNQVWATDITYIKIPAIPALKK
jgi:putative transposase